MVRFFFAKIDLYYFLRCIRLSTEVTAKESLVFARICKELNTLPGWLRIAMLLMFILGGSGFAFNTVVIIANGGKMPVATQTEDILFVIGPAEFGVKRFPTDDYFRIDSVHKPLTESTKFQILADRIPISFRFIPVKVLPTPCYTLLEAWKISAGKDAIASIGDLLMWSGVLLMFPNLLFVLALNLLRFTRRILSTT
jgi:hypothetical protein